MPTATALRVTWPSARPELRALSASAACGLAGVAVDLVLPWPLALGVDAVVDARSTQGLSGTGLLAAAGAALVVLTALGGVIEMGSVVSAERAAERVGARLRGALFDRSVSMSLRWHDGMRSGELVSRISSDTGRLLDALVAVCATLVPDAVRLVAVLIVLFLLDPTLALVALAVVPLLAALAVRQRRRVRGAQADARAASGRFASATVDLLRNTRAVQAFGWHGRAAAVFGRHNGDLLAANARAVTTQARWAPVADVVLALGSGLTLVVGGHLVVAGRLSPGDLVVATAYVAALYSPVRGLSRLSGVLAKAGASADRVAEVLHGTDRVSDRPGALQCPPLRRDLVLDGVGFGHDPAHRVVDGLDLTLRAGETVCLLGPSGIGKSTLLHLLLRLYDVDAGAILLDGRDVRELSQDSLRRQIAFVPQDPWLFDATVADNIAAGSPDATWHGIVAAARAAQAHEFIVGLPHGYDTVIGEGGVLLSGGQRRRLAIARALVSDASLLLLDEPTASLDPASARDVLAAIRRAAAGRTVLLVTHDQLTADLADRVVRLDRPSGEPVRVIDSRAMREEVTS